jgi:hypothetical protein
LLRLPTYTTMHPMNTIPQPAATNTVIGTLPVEGVGAEPGVGGRVHRPVPLLPSSQYCAAQLHSSQRNAVPGRANRSLKRKNVVTGKI